MKNIKIIRLLELS